MSSHLKIISQENIRTFNTPPKFNGEERKKFFSVPVWARETLERLRTPVNKIGFILQLGYFRAVNKFFANDLFYQKDVVFIANKHQISLLDVDFSRYASTSLERHQEIILNNLGWKKFDEDAKGLLTQEAMLLCSKQTKPRLMFLSLVDFLRYKKIEIPTYHAFSEIITQAFRNFERNLMSLFEQNLLAEDRQMLDELLKGKDEYIYGKKKDLKLRRYRLTLLKKSHQSTKPSKIKENVRDLNFLNKIFRKFKPLIDRLGLSSEIIQYYAQITIKSKIFQMHQREEKRHLFLLAFVVYQFYQLNDVLIEILIQSVQSALNSSVRDNKEKFYEERQSRHRTISELSQKLAQYLGILKRIETTVRNEKLSDGEKVNAVEQLFPDEQRQECASLQKQLEHLGKESSRITKNEDYYDILESKSIKLQNRASDIVKHLEFDEETSNLRIIEAIVYYKSKDGILASPPLGFLDTDDQSRVFDRCGKLRISLYKALLFEHVASGIRSGALNMRYSYKYRAFDGYLIPKKTWEVEQNKLLDKAGLLTFKKFGSLEAELRKAVRTQFHLTNENVITGKETHVTIGTDGRLKVRTPPQEKEIPDTPLDLFPKDRFISIFEVFSTVNKLCRFTDSLEHCQIKYNREKPPDRTFFAGIIGYGCNLGVRKVAKISRNVNPNELENTVNWYFNNENIIQANDRILEMIERLELPSVFQKNGAITHTSSDGQKFNIGVESLNSNYSYKYFGKGKGVSVYSFIDESHRLFYSTVINSSEREAAYVIDGLLHNDVVQSDIHSTDTHGYSEIIFAVTHLLGISFAPRIKDFRDQTLYAFNSISDMRNLGYPILPTGKINTKIIEEHWDDILRLVATIRLKEFSASQLFRRLSSYSKQHPLYRALKEFGRIIKTLFLLKYIDDVKLRQAIEKQLNKLESSNRFAKAVFYGNNQEFQQATKNEQLIADGCKRLIENAIICWNYLYLSQMLVDTQTESEKKNLLAVIKNGSVVAWQHINLQGEYDFSEETLKNSIEFRLPELLKLQMA